MMIMIIRMISILLLVLLLVLAFLVPCSWPFGPGPFVQAVWSRLCGPGPFGPGLVVQAHSISGRITGRPRIRKPPTPPGPPSSGPPPGTVREGEGEGLRLPYRHVTNFEIESAAKESSHTPTGRRIIGIRAGLTLEIFLLAKASALIYNLMLVLQF